MDKQRIAEGLRASVMCKRPSSRRLAKESEFGEDIGYSDAKKLQILTNKGQANEHVLRHNVTTCKFY